jgi:protein required for attachment to host cells
MAGLKIDRGEWVVVADGARALILENVGDSKFPDLRTKEVFRQPDPKTSELGTDRPGRAFNSVGSNPSAMEQTDWHEQEERRFLARLAARLDRAVQSGETKSLILVAPPRPVGVLRNEFTKHVRKALRAEIERDYVKMPVDEIAKHLAA